MRLLYRAAKRPFKRGDLRTKAWAAILPPAVAQDDPLWRERCRQYWQRQERLYGVRLSDFGMFLDPVEGVVVTFATVLDVLPGERTTDHDQVPVTA